MIVSFNFYRDHWINRLYTCCEYGHVNIQFQNGAIFEIGRYKDISHGLMVPKNLQEPDLSIKRNVKAVDLELAMALYEDPINLQTILWRNCIHFCSLALGENHRSMRRLLRTLRNG